MMVESKKKKESWKKSVMHLRFVDIEGKEIQGRIIWVRRFKEEEKEMVRLRFFFLINKFSLPFFFIRCKNDSTFHKFQIK
jgi:hypothetical protein